jgi:NAD(P)-dependent dehydrogenase (short-subunit alcohol dehydrogenase family)
VHLPLLGAYNASKAGVEALGDTLRIELRSSGARVGVAYFAALDTDMTRRGFGTRAAARLGGVQQVAPLSAGIDAIERGVARRSRRVVAPGWVAPLLPLRMLVQRGVDVAARRRLDAALAIAREEQAPLTTPQTPPGGDPR